MSETGNSNRGRHGYVASGLGVLVLGLLLAAGQLVPANFKGSTFKCLVEGPTSAMAEVSERAGVVAGHPAIWPLGRACEWDRADGVGTITTYSGSWPGTFVVLGLLLGGTILTVRPSLRRMTLDSEPS
jgi:hypothetical protein